MFQNCVKCLVWTKQILGFLYSIVQRVFSFYFYTNFFLAITKATSLDFCVSCYIDSLSSIYLFQINIPAIMSIIYFFSKSSLIYHTFKSRSNLCPYFLPCHLTAFEIWIKSVYLVVTSISLFINKNIYWAFSMVKAQC